MGTSEMGKLGCSGDWRLMVSKALLPSVERHKNNHLRKTAETMPTLVDDLLGTTLVSWFTAGDTVKSEGQVYLHSRSQHSG